ncbi:MAG: methionyl-tRNA formyltransferase [Proteobacteria bacterium]|nr:methionyl-tRNA formyltransferase [Pseudomonadota bacterium]
MLKYIYMGTPQIAARILEKLCDQEMPPALVVTQMAKPKGRGYKVTPSEVEQYARTQDLNVLETLDVNAPGTADVLKTFHADVIVVVAFGQILREGILKMPKHGCLNLHASLLPKYRGAAPVQRAIMDGERETGVTIQRIVKKLDAGDVFLQEKVEILPEETSGELLVRLAEVGGDLLVKALKKLEAGEAQYTPQDDSLVTYAKKLEKSESNLNWQQPAQALFNTIRALQPWPVAQMELHGETLRIFKAALAPGKSGATPGAVQTDQKTFIHVQCGDGQALSLLEVQQEGRKRLNIADFLKGYRWPSID